jgi:hypothetical protein
MNTSSQTLLPRKKKYRELLAEALKENDPQQRRTANERTEEIGLREGAR